MGALAPASSSWIPEDDLLLKNAVEGGASLESLAKGAVHFSCRFTLQELQSRWHSLLYDRDISAEASARILEIEIGLSAPSSSRSNKSCSVKGKEPISEKRKTYSLRKQYHTLRKKVCNIPCDYGGHDFNIPPTACDINRNIGSDDRLDAQQTDCFLGNCVPNTQVLSEHHLETAKFATGQDVFSDTQCVYQGASRALYTGRTGPDASGAYGSIQGFQTDHLVMESVDNKLPDSVSNSDRMNGHVDGISSMACDKADGKNLDQPFEQSVEIEDVPHIFEENLGTFQSYPNVQDIHPHQMLLSDMPIWGTSEETTVPAGMIVGNVEGEENAVSAPSLPPTDDAMNMDPLECDGSLSEPNLCDEVCFRAPNEGSVFVDISENPFLMDLDDKGIIDKSCFEGLNNFLMSSPNDHQDIVHNQSDPNTVEIVDTSNAVPVVACTGESNNDDPEILSDHVSGSNSFDSASCLAEASLKDPYGPLQGPVSCSLNTEDLEIPCNDDVVFPTANPIPQSSPSDLGSNYSETALLVPSSITSMDDRKFPLSNNTKEGHESSKHKLVSAVKQVGLMQPCYRDKAEFPDHVSLAGVSNNVYNAPNLLKSTAVSSYAPTIPSKEEISAPENFGKIDSFAEKSVEGSHSAKISSMNIADVCKKELEISAQGCMLSHVESTPVEIGISGQLQITSTSDQEERDSDSDNDFPCFSDIEAMILDMDLWPDDQESIFYAREVSRSRHLDTKKTIIRLEQGARSCMQRAIAANGAFAVFYGHHLKYYVKKYQVLLGRATEEIYVDIDLQKEGRANKISRRQAIIEMDENGNFSLRNMGKFPIHINDKELPTGKICSLYSGCLIEIRGMSFMFEVNWKCVRQYLSNSSMDNRARNSNFARLPIKVS